jgi:hypothetical protein
MPFRGRPMTQGKTQASALCRTAVAWDQASEERFAEITSGRSRGQQGLVATCPDSWNEAAAEGRESPRGLAQESVGAKTEGQRPRRRRNTSSRCTNYRHRAKGLWTLGGFIGSAVAGHRAGAKPTHEMGRSYGQTRAVGACANQRLTPAAAGKARGGQAKVSNRTWEIRPSGIIGGPRETWLCAGAPELYPNNCRATGNFRVQ